MERRPPTVIWLDAVPIRPTGEVSVVKDGNVRWLSDAWNPHSRVVPTQLLDVNQPFDADRPSLERADLDLAMRQIERLRDSAASDSAASAAPSTSGGASFASAAPSPALQQASSPTLVATPSVELVTSRQIQTLGTSDAGSILEETTSVRTVDIQRRSPIDFDPRVRGYHVGQVFTVSEGQQWFPARQDLDSLLSKLDPSLIEDIIVIPGPYGLRYGPGFAFVDVVTSPTPRYANGPEFHSRTGITVRANGGQLYGRETLFGGGENWGAIFSYGNRTGSDYEAGGGQLIPASYQAQNFLGQLGFDTRDDVRWEFRYQRLDQTDTEYAGQFFDLNFLITDSFLVNYINEDRCAIWDRWEIDGWYNRTRFDGDTLNQSKVNFHVIDRVEAALGFPFAGFTQGAQTSAGTRSRMVFGADDQTQLAVGADLHYRKQGIDEQFVVSDSVPPTAFGTNLPDARHYDPGLYVELTQPWHEFWSTSLAGRVDWVYTTADEAELRANTSLPGGPDDLQQSDVLYAFNLVNELQLTDDWTGRIAFGHAQRAPTLIERYADGLFLGIIQSGFSRVIGDPTLDKERAWQIDASLSATTDDWIFRLGGYHAWVLDYVTYTGNVIDDPSGARLLRTINTDLATLTGGEAYLERSLTNRLAAFAAAQYVDGRDRVIDAPLPGISPFDSRFGLRLVDAEQGRRWGLEFSTRIVNGQDRLGALRIGTTSVVDVIDLEVPTPGFTVHNVRGYWNITDSLFVVAGISNLGDAEYLEHLNLRLPDDGQFTGTRVLEPGITPYVTVEWTF